MNTSHQFAPWKEYPAAEAAAGERPNAIPARCKRKEWGLLYYSLYLWRIKEHPSNQNQKNRRNYIIYMRRTNPHKPKDPETKNDSCASLRLQLITTQKSGFFSFALISNTGLLINLCPFSVKPWNFGRVFQPPDEGPAPLMASKPCFNQLLVTCYHRSPIDSKICELGAFFSSFCWTFGTFCNKNWPTKNNWEPWNLGQWSIWS